MFIYFEGERDRAWVGEGQREREGDTESEASSRLWTDSTEPKAGLELTNHEIMTQAEVGHLANWATQAPHGFFILKVRIMMGMQAGIATLENSMEVPQKTKNRTILWPSNCTTRYLSKGYRCAVSKGHMHPHVYSSTITNSQITGRVQMSTYWRMDKEVVVLTYNGILLGDQKEWNLDICNNMDGTRMYYAKQNKSRETNMISLICGV